MTTGDLPSREDLREVVAWLAGGKDTKWTIIDWQQWSSKAYGWCYTTTKGLLRALAVIAERDAEIALLRTELAQLRRRSASVVPVAPTIVPSARRAQPPPPPEAAALRQHAKRPPTDAEVEAKRRIMEYAEEVWREVSSVDFDAEVWAPVDSSETIFEPDPSTSE